MKVLKFVGIFILGIIVGFSIGFFIKFHILPVSIDGGQLGSLAEWVSGIGTISAVWIALNSRWDNVSIKMGKKIYSLISEADKRVSNQQLFSQAYSNLLLAYAGLASLSTRNQFQYSKDECMELLKKAKSSLLQMEESGLMQDEKKSFDDQISQIKQLINSNTLDEDIITNVIISLNQKGKEINRKLDNYIDETNKLYENIRKLQKDYNVPNKLIIP